LVQGAVASGRYNAGMRSPVRRAKRIVHTWRQAQVLLERWRKNLTDVQVELKQPRVTDVTPIDFVSGEPVEPQRNTHQAASGTIDLLYECGCDDPPSVGGYSGGRQLRDCCHFRREDTVGTKLARLSLVFLSENNQT